MSTKKLSLEERLSLATKKGKKKVKKVGKVSENEFSQEATPEPPLVIDKAVTSETTSSPTLSINANEQVTSEEPENTEDTPANNTEVAEKGEVEKHDGVITTNKPSVEKTTMETVPVPSNYNLKGVIDTKSEPWKSILPKELEKLNIIEVIRLIIPYTNQLYSKSIQLEEQIKHLKNQQKKNDNSVFINLIKEKDTLISKLNREAELAVKKESSYNDEIKSLNKTVSKYENTLSKTEDKLEISQSELKTLKIKHKDLEKEHSEFSNKNKELEVQITELQHAQTSLDESSSMVKVLEEQVEQLSNSISEKEAQFAAETKSLILNHEVQVTNLELKIEQLRIEMDSIKDKKQDSSENKTRPSSGFEGEITQEQYNILQEQLLSSKKNWNSIENSLNRRLNELDLELQNTKLEETRLRESDSKNKSFCERLNAELEKELAENSKLTVEIANLTEQLANKVSLIEEIQGDFKLLQNKYDIQRSQIGQQLENSGTKAYRVNSVSSNFSINIEENWIDSAKSPLDYDVSNNYSDDNETINENNTSNIIDGNNDSNDMLPIDSDSIPDEAMDLQLKGNSSNNITFDSSLNLGRRQSNQFQKSSQLNTQMISKLGIDIRRLELEISSLNDKNNRLQTEKSNANAEILKLLEENESSQKLKEECEQLQNQVKDFEKKLETSLILLGEKTEQVEELKNDVEDLKELIRDQAQQMVMTQEDPRK